MKHGPEHIDNHLLSVGAYRVKKHRWHPEIVSDWLKEDSYPHPINDFHIVLSHEKPLHPIHDMTTGGARAQRHRSWRAQVDSPWLDHDLDPGHVQEFSINMISPWLVDLEVHPVLGFK